MAPPTALPWRHQTLAYSAAPDRYALYPALPQLRPRSQAPSRLTTTDMRCLLDHARTRYNTLAWGGSPTGRFCPVHDWPVFRCPPRAEGKPDRLPALAAELVRRNVDVIVSTGGDAAALAAKNATRTIPIVFIAGGDPVGLGLVSSLGRPGRNMTGVSILVSELDAKRLALLKDLVPKVTFVAVLLNPLNPNTGLP